MMMIEKEEYWAFPKEGVAVQQLWLLEVQLRSYKIKEKEVLRRRGDKEVVLRSNAIEEELEDD